MSKHKKKWGFFKGFKTTIQNLVPTVGIVKPSLEIKPEPYAVMFHATQAAVGEVSGLGKITKISETHYVVTEAVILGQSASAGYTELSDEAMNDFLYELAKQKKNPSEYNLWWHSHSTMSVFWSSVDEENARRLTEKRELISIVLNKEGKLLARLDKVSYTIHNLPCKILPQEIKGLKDKIYEEVKTKVKPKVYASHGKAAEPLYGYDGYDDGYGDLGYSGSYGSYYGVSKTPTEQTDFESFKGYTPILHNQKCPSCYWQGKEEIQIVKCPKCGKNGLQLA